MEINCEIKIKKEAMIVTEQDTLNDCFEIRYSVFTKEQGIPGDIDIDEYDVIDFEKSCHVIIYDAQKPVATGRLKYRNNNTVQFNRIAVLKDYRGYGLGAEILKILEKFTIGKGYSNVYLESQSSAKEFYIKNGYTELDGNEFVIAGVSHVRLGKKLNTLWYVTFCYMLNYIGFS